MDIHEILDYLAWFIAGASIVQNLLPPIEMLESWGLSPKTVRRYAVFVNLVQYYAAQNWRGKIARAYIARENGGKSDAT